jgi:hypothetical protein
VGVIGGGWGDLAKYGEGELGEMPPKIFDILDIFVNLTFTKK